jgi:hypothetical protein
MEKLAQEETRIEQLQTAIAGAADETKKAAAAIGTYVAKMSF